MKIAATQIVKDRGLQAREKLSPEKVREYTDILADGEALPPINVFRDLKNPEKYWLADGWHRDAAAESLGLPDRECCVHEGGRTAAFLHADLLGKRPLQKALGIPELDDPDPLIVRPLISAVSL